MYGSTTNAFQIESGPFQIHSLIDGRNTAMPFKSFVRLRVLQLHSYLHQQVLAVVSSAGRCFVVVDSSRRTPPSPHATAFPVFAIDPPPPRGVGVGVVARRDGARVRVPLRRRVQREVRRTEDVRLGKSLREKGRHSAPSATLARVDMESDVLVHDGEADDHHEPEDRAHAQVLDAVRDRLHRVHAHLSSRIHEGAFYTIFFHPSPGFNI